MVHTAAAAALALLLSAQPSAATTADDVAPRMVSVGQGACRYTGNSHGTMIGCSESRSAAQGLAACVADFKCGAMDWDPAANQTCLWRAVTPDVHAVESACGTAPHPAGCRCYKKDPLPPLPPSPPPLPPSPPPPAFPPKPEPAQPKIAAGFESSNIFWPGETGEDGTVFACTYIPTLVYANHSRLIAHGSCGTSATDCNGFHLRAQARAAAFLQRTGSASSALLGSTATGNPIAEGKVCQKHSDDGGRTWSKIRVAMKGVDCGQIIWDDIRKVLIAHYSTVVPTKDNGSPGNGATLEYRSTDLGDTWSAPRCLTISNQSGAHGAKIPLCADPKTSSRIQGGTPTGDGGNSIWTSAGAALQLSASNKFHPGRMLFTGHVNGCQQWWYTDDGETYTFAKNETGHPLCVIGEGEVGFAETPDGGITSSGRNGVFHGPGKCNCRAVVRSHDGGTTFNQTLDFDPVLVSPICQATMVNGDAATGAGAIFHANPGHGTPKESKSPPDGRASGTVRRSTDGGATWTSVVLNGNGAYSYSCLAKIDESYIGLAWETVLPGSGVPDSWSANNVVFTRIPQNFSGALLPASVSYEH